MFNNENFSTRLRKLSEILIKEEKKLLPTDNDFIDDLTYRSADLWRIYFSNGIMLSSGGVETSLFGLKDIQHYPELQSFNEYPGSLNSYANLTQKLGKRFLLEEGLISTTQKQDTLEVAYSLGSHEGLMRAARIIYRREWNDGCFFPTGCYGLIVSAFRDLKPLSYKICLVNSDIDRGEKVSLSHLEILVGKNPSIKTLFIEQKTTAGAAYTEAEMNDIINFCKVHKLFLIVDSAHVQMEFDEKYKFPSVSSLSQKLDYHDYVVLFTGSKTYGMERGRVGLVLFDRRHRYLTLKAMEDQFVKMFGTFSDLPIVVAHRLMTFPLAKRQEYLRDNIIKHKYNMNLILAYIEGIESDAIDPNLRETIRSELPKVCLSGIAGLRVLYKPQGGIHLKVDVSEFKNKYFYNVQMFNSEILCYTLNKMYGVVTLHSFQITDLSSYGMRLSFSSKNDIHAGMRLMSQFFGALTLAPQTNPFMEKIISLDSLKESKNQENMTSNNTLTLSSRL